MMRRSAVYLLDTFSYPPLPSAVEAPEREATLMLGGKRCDRYRGETEAALMKITITPAIDFEGSRRTPS
jgi:hypothetical protein